VAPISRFRQGKDKVVTSHTARRLVVIGGFLLAALAGCGSAPQGTTPPEQPSGPVSTRDLPGTGMVLVDTLGRTLYFTDSETAGGIKCTADCMKLWVPAMAPSDKPQGAGVGVVQRPDGTKQLTYQDKPLYTFTLDSKDKPASGDKASDSFSGVDFTWHAVVVKASVPAPTTTGDGGSGGGSGY
jgi:predicted lipoprotein with Yx(FWY)xxD motif